MTNAIEVVDLAKSYGRNHAVAGVSFTVAEGEIFAILGPNGAGKSTTVEILEGHRRRDGGSVTVLGTDPEAGGRSFRDRIGIVLQSAGIDRVLSVREVLNVYAMAYTSGRPVDEVLQLVELSESADKRVSTLSGGQQRRVDLALGLIGDPELIFLDEPTTGFDPAARRRSWELIRSLANRGRTVVLTTHYLEEAEYLADRVAVMSGGQIVASGTTEELRTQAGSSTVIGFALPPVDAPIAELVDPLVGEVLGRDRRLEVVTPVPTADLARITTWAVARGIELDGLTVQSRSFEDVYLQLVGDQEGS